FVIRRGLVCLFISTLPAPAFYPPLPLARASVRGPVVPSTKSEELPEHLPGTPPKVQPATSAVFAGQVGHTYRFCSAARDNAGTPAHTSPDASVTLAPNRPPTLTCANQSVSLGGSLPINPTSVPSDNGSIAPIVVQNRDTDTGGISVRHGFVKGNSF